MTWSGSRQTAYGPWPHSCGMGFPQPLGPVATWDRATLPGGAVEALIGGDTAAAGLALRAGCHGERSSRFGEVASAVALRAVTSSDAPAIGGMWERCSPATRMARFHAPVRDIPASYLKAVLADPAANILAVREPGGGAVALASLISGAGGSSGPGSPGGGTAELGVLVEDAWQRRGIGRRLVAYLVGAASARGISTLTAVVLARNAEVAELLRQVPGEFSMVGDGETLDVRVRLAGSQNLMARPIVNATPNAS
jgi:GNAT superfamily N-acetyltransferase